MIFLLDTTVLIDTLRARNSRRALLAQFVTSGHTLATAAINIGEVYAGMRPEEKEQTESFLSGLECFPMDGTIARRAGLLKSEFARQGRTLSLPDMIIAATSLEHGATLVTDNRRDFPIPQLDLYLLPPAESKS